MKNTYKAMNSIILPVHRNMTMEQLVECYADEHNPSALASAFCRSYKLIIQVSKNYFWLDDEDIASFSLEELDKCLNSYDLSKEVSFSTYYFAFLKNRFRMETQALSTDKRKAIFISDSLDLMIENGFEPEDLTEDSIEYLCQVLKELDLNSRELEYCRLVMLGYNNKDISGILQTSIMTLSNIRKKLRLKINQDSLVFLE